MNARKRQAKRRNWPDNLYQNSSGYLWFRNPLTGKGAGLGTDLQAAIKKVKRANLELARIREEQDLLALTSEGAVTLAERCTAYEAEYAVGKKNTVLAIKSQLNAIRGDIVAKKPLDQIAPKDAAELVKRAVDERGPTMARTIRSRLSDVFRDAITHGLVERNPVESILKPKVVVRRMRMTEEMFWKIFEQLEHSWAKNASLLALVSGQRLGDILAMRFEDVKDGFLWVDQQKLSGRVKLKIPLSTRLGEHSIESVVAMCRDGYVSRYLIHHAEGRYSSKHGKPISRAALQREFGLARDKAEIVMPEGTTPTSFHEIRSLSARLHAESNSPGFAQALLGHSSAAMTEMYRDYRGQQWVEVKASKAG